MTTTAPPERPLVLIPAWNEAASIAGTLAELRSHLPHLDVLVVDDGSVDATATLAAAAGAQVVRLPYNLGIGGALRAGFKYALRHGYDAVVQFDADGQHRPHDVPNLLAGLTHYDLVIGNRFSASSAAYSVTGARSWAMRLLTSVLSRMSGYEIRDTTSGFRAVGPRLLPLFAAHYPVDYLDNIEAIVMTVRSGHLIGEAPVTMRTRQGGQPSQTGPKLALHFGRTVFMLALSLIRRWPTTAPLDSPLTAARP